MTTDQKGAAEATNVVPLHPQVPKDCLLGLHSWIGEAGLLHPDTQCAHCGETYGDPD